MKKIIPYSLIITAVLFLSLLAPVTSWAWGLIQGFVCSGSDAPAAGLSVCDDPDDLPIAGALVQTDLASATTGVDGSYILAHQAGDFTLTASASGFDSLSQEISVADNPTPIDLDFSLSPSPPVIENVTPSLGQLGNDLDITIHGTGFDSNTRVSMYLDTGGKEKIIGAVDTPDSAYAVAIHENTAYVANRANGLQVIDISNPSQPSITTSISTGGWADGITINSNIAYVAAGDLLAINIDPDSSVYSYLEVIDTAVTPGRAAAVTVTDGIAYVAEDLGVVLINVDRNSAAYSYLEIIDTMQMVDEYGFDVNVNGLTVVGNRAYLATGYNTIFDGTQLKIVDVDPASEQYLEVIGSQYTTDAAQDVAVIGNNAYVADNMGGLLVIDVNPDSNKYLEIIDTVKTTSKVVDVTVNGSTLYMASSSDGLQIIDIDPASENYLNNIGSVDTPDIANGVAVVGSTAYVADKSGLQIIDVSNPSPTTIIGSMDSPTGIAFDIAVKGNTTYLADNSEYLQVIDVNPQSETFLTILNSVQTANLIQGVTVEGSSAYVANGWAGLLVLDISNPELPVSSGSVDTAGNAQAVTVSGNIAYVADGYSGLQVIDVSDALDGDSGTILDATDILGTVNTDDEAQAVAVSGSIAYVADSMNGLVVVDVSDALDGNPGTILDAADIIDTVNTPGYASDAAVIGNTVYVADGESLQIIDIDPTPGNPTYLQIIGSMDLPAYRIRATGNTLYVTGLAPSVQAIDVSNPKKPVLFSTMDIQGYATNITVSGNTAYVTDSFVGPCCPSYTGGLTLIPVPIKLSPLDLVDDTQINATLPSPLIAGNYTLRAFNNKQHDELFGAVTFTDNADLLHARAIIVAGGGPDATGDIWEETKNYAQEAYNSLLYQGYKPENIYYMTDDGAAPGRDAGASRLNLQYAVTDWANDDPETTSLVLYLVDHGENEQFQIRGHTNPALAEYVTAGDLDSWLDNLQAGVSLKVLLVYDACFSGSFVDSLREPSDTRVVITSVDDDEVAYFLDLQQSFSGVFWGTLSGKTGTQGNLYNAWNLASANMANYQAAQLDANGNGVTNEPEDVNALEQNIFTIGRQWFNAGFSRPIVNVVAADQILPPPGEAEESSAPLSAWGVYDLDKNEIVRVWAEVIAPDFIPSSNVTITSLPTVDLEDQNEDGTYTALFPDDAASSYPGFTVQGTYIVNYYAEDSTGVYSLPKTSLVIQKGYSPPVENTIKDQYEDDDAPNKAQVIVLNNPTLQNHSFHDSGDEDWVKFYGLAGEVYSVKAMNPTVISDPMLSIYSESNLNTPVASSNKAGMGTEEHLKDWTCPDDGLYYVRITNNSPHFGANVRYKLKVYNPIAFSLPGYVKGRITSGGKGVSGAVVRAGGGTAITLPDGSFILCLKPGSYSVSVSCSGYQSTSFSVNVGSGQSVNLSPRDMNSIPRIINTPPPIAKANELYSFIPVVVDADGDPITFAITGKPGWASFNPASGRLWGTPGNNDEGTHGPVTIRATDSSSASDSVVFNIKVVSNPSTGLPSIFLLLLGQ